jgi:hypothetical protein
VPSIFNDAAGFAGENDAESDNLQSFPKLTADLKFGIVPA